MRTKIYEIADHDVIETFFGESPRSKAIVDIAKDHGDLIFEGECTPVVDCGDVLGIDTDEEIGKIVDPDTKEERPIFRQDEYIIIVRYYHADDDILWLLVHPRHQVEVELS